MKKILLIVLITFLLLGCSNNKELSIKDAEIESLQQKVVSLEQELKDSQHFNKYYNKAEKEYLTALFNSGDAEYNYEMSGWYYDDDYFVEAISYCEGARNLYVEANSNYQKSISYFVESNKTSPQQYKELIHYYIKVCDQAIDINWAMYEACEYFESASYQYIKNNWDVGDEALERSNEKILLHDSLVKSYNSDVARLDVLREQI